jgi:hypothetical protein
MKGHSLIDCKAQAAMEFLMTYGWAIMVVIAVIALLAYFGVLSPDRFLPEKCVLEQGFLCVNQKVEPGRVSLDIGNAIGRTVTITSIDVAGCGGLFNEKMQNGAQKNFDIGGACNNGKIREKFKADITISYIEKDSNTTKTAYGVLNTVIE